MTELLSTLTAQPTPMHYGTVLHSQTNVMAENLRTQLDMVDISNTQYPAITATDQLTLLAKEDHLVVLKVTIVMLVNS